MSTKERKKLYSVGKKSYRLAVCDHVLDTIYGQIGLTEVERELEHLSIFKRLHNISQLGLVNWIFPCALHTRYTHSIGVMHIAGEMAIHINSNTKIETPFFDDDDIQIIRLAGLLHDIGHYPMSHNVEQAYKDASDSMKRKAGSKQTPTQRLKAITKCPAFLNPMAEPERVIPKNLHKLSKEEVEELKIFVKNRRLNSEVSYFDSFAGSTGHHHENIGNLIIISNQSIHDKVRDHYILLSEDGETVLNPKFAPQQGSETGVSEEQVEEITTHLLEAIGEMVRGNYENKTSQKLPWLRKYSAMIQLIHSELDADNLDYLLRDATFSGTSYGTMDMGILLNCLTVAKFQERQGKKLTGNYRYIVGIRKKGLGCVEQFLLNKYLAYTQMIMSKYVSILESMLLCFEADYVIESEDDEDYSCDGLEKMVSKPDPASKYYGFSDHYIFQKIYSYKKSEKTMKPLPKAIVSQLNGLRAFNLAECEQNEFICTGFSDNEIRESIQKSTIYKEFSTLCERLREQEVALEDRKASSYEKDLAYDAEKYQLFPFRFERYSLTKQLPLDIFANKFLFYYMSPERRFSFHYYRLADGIPILEQEEYDYNSSYRFHKNPLTKEKDVARLFNIPKLCVDSEQSCLHQTFSMQYVSLRQYQIGDAS